MENNSIGKVTVGYGTPEQREIEIKAFLQANFIDNRLISVSETENDEGFILLVENPKSSGRQGENKMWLSRDSFIGLLTVINLYTLKYNIDPAKELEEKYGKDINFKFASR